MYLAAASELKSKLLTSSPLLSVGFKEEIVQFQGLLRGKGELLDELWVQWGRCRSEIEKLGRDEGILKQEGDGDSPPAEDQHKALDKAKDDVEFGRLIEEIKTVGRVWTKKMDDSEKVCFGTLMSLISYEFNILTCTL